MSSQQPKTLIELFEDTGDKIISVKEMEEIRSEIDKVGLHEEFKNLAVAPIDFARFEAMNEAEIEAVRAIAEQGAYTANGLKFSDLEKFGTDYISANAAIFSTISLVMYLQTVGKSSKASILRDTLNDPNNAREMLQAYSQARDFGPERAAGKLKPRI